ncbi:hypothetical protein PUMCH_001496 [Australozyma saopauloensis]|uniref:Uncharacterized protein n=1 Tax=Australozyma saopauloensis TaxID=291208 RepID=A0AAX4H6X9_9ASCO|nr:hypothetical protein PUMCH_001496 [[Candida] saopauloensis]
MTKYQRGEAMEGWNDCPLPMLSKGTAPRSRKRTLRTGMPGQANTLNSDLANESLESITPAPVQRTNNNTPEVNLREIESIYGLAGQEGGSIVANLIEILATLEEPHKAFLNEILTPIVAKEPATGLKGQIVKYMMMNSGASLWCMDLQRLIDTIQV